MNLSMKLVRYFNELRYASDGPLDPEVLREAAENGNAKAQFLYAWTFSEENFHETLAWVRKSAEQNFVPAMGTLSTFYCEGIGVPKTPEKGFEWAQKTYALDPQKGSNVLGFCFLFGIGVRKDSRRAVSLFEEGTHSEDPFTKSISKSNLAYCFILGDGVRKDRERAFSLLQECDLNVPQSAATLAYCYMYGIGTTRDFVRAKELLEKSAEAGCAEAVSTLGVLYYRGWGVKKDTKRALELFQLAAQSGKKIPCFNAGSALLRRFHLFQSLPYFWRGGWRGKLILVNFAVILCALAVLFVQKYPAGRDSASSQQEESSSSLFVGTRLEMTGTFLDGTAYRSEEYEGKVVLLDFWATWCPPCRRELLTNLVPLYRKFHSSGFEIIGISCDSDAETVQDFAHKNKVAWKHILEPNAKTNGRLLSNYFGVEYIPFTVLIGRDGKIVSVDARGDLLATLVERELQKKSEDSAPSSN